MKKLLFVIGIIFMNIVISAGAASDLKFTPREGGKYIYSNNREFIFRTDLADNSNMNPRYIMSNEDMGADKYTLFASHVNHTEIKDSYGIMSGKGFDVELDVVFCAKEDTDITITAMGFEVPENVKYYINAEEYTMEKDWGCFTAWASYLGREISELDSGEKYQPVPFETVQFTVKAGEKVYMSEFIPNYRAVPIWRPVHLITDFEITKGLCDINVFAVRSDGGVTGNRRYVSKNISFGSFIPQYEMKGVANSQNQVDAYLDLTIPADVWDQTKLPVTVYNRYALEGNTVTTWYTNLNPTSDIWNKNNVAESCMLEFEYKDPLKKNYYGKGVKEEDKDDVWHFDTSHALLWEYKSGVGYTKRNFVPNFELKKDISEEYCNSLGNYGVFQNYHITVTNDGYVDRWFNYCLNTGANNLIILSDENGNIYDGYPITKGTVGVKESDRLVNIKVPAKESVKFILTVILTTNYPGGMENSFVISDMPYPVYTYDSNYIYNVRDTKYTGREYVRFENGNLYISSDGEEWTHKPISSEVKNILETSSEIKLTWTGDGYIVNNTQHSGIPYYNVRDFYREVWALDENFELKWKDNFGIYPTDASGAFGIYYIKAGSNYYSYDGKKWELLGGNINLPCYNYGRFAASAKNGEIYLSEDGLTFSKVIYEGKKPPYIDALGDIYYYIDGLKMGVSADGVYWSEFELPCEVKKLGRKGNNILINENTEAELPELLKDNHIVKFNGTYIGFENEPVEIDSVYYIPLRAFAEIMGGSVEWNSETNTATVNAGGKTADIGAWEETEYGSAIIYDGKMMLPESMLNVFN